MGRFILIVLIFIIGLSLDVTSKTVEKESLYDDGDAGITNFDQDNFDKLVYDQSSIWLIEFYNQWCGHCIRYAPVFKNFAKDVQGWSAVVRIGAVNCASSKNTEICRLKEINVYPTLKIFESHSNSESMGSDFPADKDEKLLKKNLLEYLITASKDKKWPASFPTLQFLEGMDHIWPGVPTHHQTAVIIFEEEESTLGMEVILEISSLGDLPVRRMKKDAALKYRVETFPSVFHLERDGRFEEVKLKTFQRDKIVTAIKQVFGAKNIQHVPVKEEKSDPNKLLFEKNKTPIKQIHGLHMKDLESGLHYSLRQEVALRRMIDGESLTALKLYIKALALHFPGRLVVVNFLKSLHGWLEDTSSSISGEEWVSKIDNLQTKDSYLPDKVEWVCCRGSEAKFRGYPCSMWSLFHTLTVNAHNYQKEGDNPLLVLQAMRGYIKNFFGCKECSHNFYKMASSLENQVESNSDAVLWLWAAHNTANLRLHGDASEDPTHLKIQFPSDKDCSDCFDGHNDKGIPLWDETKVLEFLLHYYDQTSIVNDVISDNVTRGSKPSRKDADQLDWWERQQRKADLQKLADIRQQKREKLKNRTSKNFVSTQYHSAFGKEVKYEGHNRSSFVTPWGFNQIDVSLCMLLWLISSAIIILLYFHIMAKRKKKNCKLFPCV